MKNGIVNLKKFWIHGFTNIEAGKHKNSKKRVVYIFEYIRVLTYNYKMNPIINFLNDEY